MIIKGNVSMQENKEKHITMTGVEAPLPVAFLTKAYAVPAPKPPYSPIKAGTSSILPGVGLKIRSAPVNAMIVAMISVFDGLSLSSGIETSIAKNGDNLLSILASARMSRSIA